MRTERRAATPPLGEGKCFVCLCEDVTAKDIALSLGDISSPAEPDRSSQSQASGTAGGGSARPQRGRA